VGARQAGAAAIVNPTPYAVGSIAATLERYPNARGILPAMGYGATQVRDLEASIEAVADAGMCDAVVAGTPIDLTRVLEVSVPIVRARYELRERTPGQLDAAVRDALARRGESAAPAFDQHLATT
jgi:predicted GTPase